MCSEIKHSAVVIIATRVGTLHLIDNMVLEQ
jgi:pantothenate synthetase